MANEFTPHPLLRGGHAQTIAGWAMKPRRGTLPPAEERLFDVAPGVQVLCKCHFHPCTPIAGAPGTPDWQQPIQNSKGKMQNCHTERSGSCLTLLLVHGLEGSSESNYIVGTASKAFAAGMSVVRMNIRNCGGTERLSRTLYHSGLSEDVGAVAAALAKDERVGQLAIAGFSLGGNQVLKLAGEWGEQVPSYVTAVAAVSPAMDLGASCDLLHRWRNRIYEWQFLRSLKRRAKVKNKIHREEGRMGDRTATLSSLRSMRDFDDRVTAPAFGFAGAADYYARASASPWLSRIRVPTLVIYAKDDPFICVLPETRERLQANPKITLRECEHGGHCGFLGPKGQRWAEELIVEFVSESA